MSLKPQSQRSAGMPVRESQDCFLEPDAIKSHPGASSLARLRLAVLFVAVSAALNAEAAEPSRSFPHPDRIRYDAQCLTVEGRDIFIYSGAFHYFRCAKPLWRDRFQRIKEAGFNTVETYVPWNWHEMQMPSGPNDFSKVDLSDLEDWINMAGEFGLYTIIRPGPYICSEWDEGGFPHWLLTRKPDGQLPGESWLRSDDPDFLVWSKHWYDAVCPVIARHQITRQAPSRPGVILVQLENEYDFPRFSDEVKANQIRALARAALDNGIEVPLFTCWTRVVRRQTDPLLHRVFDSYNAYPRWDVDGILKDIQKLRRDQPDAPLMTTELQGGWFSQIGGKLSEAQDGVTASQINNLALFTIQNGQTILNCYMLFGGTNPGDRAGRNITTTYDYNAPIREWGGVGERYQRVQALGRMLGEHGARLARAEGVECNVTVPQKDVSVVVRRAPDGSRYLFVRTSQHSQPRSGVARAKERGAGAVEVVFNYDLEPFGSKVLYLPPGVNDAARGEWLPKAIPAIERPASLPEPLTLVSARRRTDPGPESWIPMRPGQSLDQLGIYDSRFLFYRVKLESTTATNLIVEHPTGDGVLAAANGKLVRRSGGTQTTSIFAMPGGTNNALLLYENCGHPHGGAGIEQRAGLFAARATERPTGDQITITGWRKHEVDGTTRRPEVQPDFRDDNWTPVAVDSIDASDLAYNTIAVYRARVALTAADLNSGAWSLNLGRVDDRGIAYVNGIKVGATADWSRSYSFDVTRQLHPGTNVVAVVVHNIDGTGGLGVSSFGRAASGAVVPLESLGNPAGVEQQWWDPALDVADWESATIGKGASSSHPDALLAWYRMDFKLPAPAPGVWVPWRLRLTAAGNGFLYLNGHPIGRYWEAGPQHDFFLPECWLNFGPGSNNVLTLSLRPTDKGEGIQSATVEPYAGYSEKRAALSRQ
jgi:hypothetical protein